MVERAGFAGSKAELFMEKQDDFYLSEEAMEWIGLKKSEYLSKIIENQAPDDFGFEDFHRFDHLVGSTLENPDEIWESSDTYPVHVYARTYEQDVQFHHILIGALFPNDEKKKLMLVPILSFVTKTSELARLFCTGDRKKRPTLN